MWTTGDGIMTFFLDLTKINMNNDCTKFTSTK